MSRGNNGEYIPLERQYPEATPDDTAPDLKRTRRSRGDRRASTPSVDRLPPHSPEAEQGVLGCILLSPNDCVPEVIGKLRSGPSEMYDLRHQTILETVMEMYDSRIPIDLITLQERLKLWGNLEAVGGIAYIAALPDTVPSSANLEYYLDIVHEKYLLRRLISTCTDVVGRVYDYEGEVDALLDEAERDILRIGEQRVVLQNRDPKELVRATLTMIEDRVTNQGKLMGLGTGFVDLDRMTNGLKGGEMIVFAARPSMGKTSLAMNIADYVSVELGVPVGVFSLEMTAEALMLRMVCARARVNLSRVSDGFLVERDYPKITNAAGKLANAPLYIDDSSGLSILQLRAKARRLAQRYGIKLLVIDYLQLLHSTNRKADSRQQEVADISSGVKGLCKELGIPVIVLSQLNRDVEREKGRRPRLSDLRESGAIEQDADVVGLLYRPRNPNQDDEDTGEYVPDDALPVNIALEKQRNGPTGDISLTFLKGYTRFESAARVSDEDVPPQLPLSSSTASLPYNDS